MKYKDGTVWYSEWTSIDGDVKRYITKIRRDGCYEIILNDKHYCHYRGWSPNTSNLNNWGNEMTPATQDQINHINACIEARKYVDLPEENKMKELPEEFSVDVGENVDKVLQSLEDRGVKWVSGHKPTRWKPTEIWTTIRCNSNELSFNGEIKDTHYTSQEFLDLFGRENLSVPKGYISWDGGKNPAPNQFVQYIMRSDGSECYAKSDHLRWNDFGEGGDIIAYRVVPEKYKLKGYEYTGEFREPLKNDYYLSAYGEGTVIDHSRGISVGNHSSYGKNRWIVKPKQSDNKLSKSIELPESTELAELKAKLKISEANELKLAAKIATLEDQISIAGKTNGILVDGNEELTEDVVNLENQLLEKDGVFQSYMETLVQDRFDPINEINRLKKPNWLMTILFGSKRS